MLLSVPGVDISQQINDLSAPYFSVILEIMSSFQVTVSTAVSMHKLSNDSSCTALKHPFFPQSGVFIPKKSLSFKVPEPEGTLKLIEFHTSSPHLLWCVLLRQEQRRTRLPLLSFQSLHHHTVFQFQQLCHFLEGQTHCWGVPRQHITVPSSDAAPQPLWLPCAAHTNNVL